MRKPNLYEELMNVGTMKRISVLLVAMMSVALLSASGIMLSSKRALAKGSSEKGCCQKKSATRTQGCGGNAAYAGSGATTCPHVAGKTLTHKCKAQMAGKPKAAKMKTIYVCPMKEDSEVVSSKPGKCPKCGMDLVKKLVPVKKK